MIEVQGLSKSFGDMIAVKELNFSIAEGTIVGLLGPNGAGKTTTMRMLTTYLAPTAGSATIAGYDIRKNAPEIRQLIGYLPETPPLYLEMTVDAYLRFVARIKGVPRRAVHSEVEKIEERCGLKDVRKRLCGELSKGFRQRVGIAQALVHNPKVIILDEPTSGLDPSQIIEIRQLIRELGSAHTVILSTHILPEVAETCTRVIIIAHGRMVVEGELADLTKDRTLEDRFLDAVSTAS